MIAFVKAVIRLYRLLTVNTRHTCRFVPTCSQLAEEAIDKYGVLKGSMLALKRIFACHPFSKRPIYDPLI